MARIQVVGALEKVIEAQQGENLHHLLTSNGVPVSAPCGGRGTCGKCKVRVFGETSEMSGSELKFLSEAERAQGVRLACAVRVLGDMKVEIVDEEAVILVDSQQADIALDPSVQRQCVSLPEASLEDQRSDAKRLCDGIDRQLYIPRDLLAELPDRVRAKSLTAAWFGDRLIDVVEADRSDRLYGVAVDIGTTTLAGYLMDLRGGNQLAVASGLNPQKAFGADVISRVDFASRDEKSAREMRDALLGGLNDMIRSLCASARIDARDILHVTLAGNTVMMHLFAGLPSKHIAVIPFTPVYTDAFTIQAAEAGLCVHPRAGVTLLSCVAGYVGADTVAAVLGSGMYRHDALSLLVDIGTNGEIVLGNKDRMVACSAAAGPAFEGAHIRHGMGGVAGAISRVRFDGGVHVRTIENLPARGVCGSGLVDAVAGLLRAEAMDSTGRLDPDGAPRYAERFVEVDGHPAFALTENHEIVITQKDIREVQLAKGAIAAGIEILSGEMGVEAERIDRVYLAGGFGNYIDYDSACAIGLLPAALRARITPIGNAAGAGAKMALLNRGLLETSCEVARRIGYVELSARADFQGYFMDKMLFE